MLAAQSGLSIAVIGAASAAAVAGISFAGQRILARGRRASVTYVNEFQDVLAVSKEHAAVLRELAVDQAKRITALEGEAKQWKDAERRCMDRLAAVEIELARKADCE